MSIIDEARALQPPQDTLQKDGFRENQNFWHTHERLIAKAWTEFGLGDTELADFQEEFIDPDLLEAIKAVRAEPTAENEARLRNMWKQLLPGVYTCQIFTPNFVRKFRAEIERHRTSGIPMRRPNSMNRYGLVLNENNNLHNLMKTFVAKFSGPLAQMLLPNNVGPEDCKNFHAFTVRYVNGEDVALSLHRDTSIATLNVNINNPEDAFEGSQLYFYELGKPQIPANQHFISFEAGKALIHLGDQMHEAMPITSGERTNLIVWMYRPEVPGCHKCHSETKTYTTDQQMTTEQRWRV